MVRDLVPFLVCPCLRTASINPQPHDLVSLWTRLTPRTTLRSPQSHWHSHSRSLVALRYPAYSRTTSLPNRLPCRSIAPCAARRNHAAQVGKFCLLTVTGQAGATGKTKGRGTTPAPP